jgi:hypothetical protein
VWHLRSAARREPVRIGAGHWLGMISGAGIIVISFARDYENLLAGGMPNRFNWAVFFAGLGIGVGSYVLAGRTPRRGQNAMTPMQSAETAP